MKKVLLPSFLLILAIVFSTIATYGQTTPDQALGGAIFTKNLPMLLEAIKNGADVNAKMPFIAQTPSAGSWNFEKGSPLMYAISVDWYEGVLELLRADAKVHFEADAKTRGFSYQCPIDKVEKVTAIFFAKYYGNVNIAKVLIIKGAETRAICNAYYPKGNPCKQNYGQKVVMLNLRDDVSEALLAVYKEGKKAEWAKAGLPAEGQTP